ncbi:hypothetical protein [Caproiciproducens sp. MSJ-32]|uniref:hypothetical protein n=1 Tax=Caproiciproducens sp. MSJ-32 TaxID=2841527 RepID=UPI001C11AEEE|nr:hypothetical protein [Caproiciproducens sp. MSJ-32]MBU5455950.1 hypothetical protein [Caproiciproducens sp. MSJ-32]
MENSKLPSLMVFAFCSAVNDNLDSIYYIYKLYGKSFENIKNNKAVLKLSKNAKSIFKDLFK